MDKATAQTMADDARTAANNIMDLSGASIGGIPNVRAWVETRECVGELQGQRFYTVAVAILGHSPSNKLGSSKHDKAIRAAIAAAAAEVDQPVQFRIDG